MFTRRRVAGSIVQSALQFEAGRPRRGPARKPYPFRGARERACPLNVPVLQLQIAEGNVGSGKRARLGGAELDAGELRAGAQGVEHPVVAAPPANPKDIQQVRIGAGADQDCQPPVHGDSPLPVTGLRGSLDQLDHRPVLEQVQAAAGLAAVHLRRFVYHHDVVAGRLHGPGRLRLGYRTVAVADVVSKLISPGEVIDAQVVQMSVNQGRPEAKQEALRVFPLAAPQDAHALLPEEVGSRQPPLPFGRKRAAPIRSPAAVKQQPRAIGKVAALGIAGLAVDTHAGRHSVLGDARAVEPAKFLDAAAGQPLEQHASLFVAAAGPERFERIVIAAFEGARRDRTFPPVGRGVPIPRHVPGDVQRKVVQRE